MLKQYKQRQLFLKNTLFICSRTFFVRSVTILEKILFNMFTFYHIAKVIYLYYNINKTYTSHEIQKSIATMSDSLILLLRGKV